jgi:hypothetical protein
VLRWFFRLFFALIALALVGAGFLYWKLRAQVEPIPAVLAAVDDRKAGEISLPGIGEQPALVLAEQRGHVTYLVLEGKDSMASGEGRELTRALDRWKHAPDVRGFFVGETEGLGFLRWKIDDFVAAIQRESRLPVYMDYEGKVLRGFQLAKGHTGLVVLGKDGEVLLRKSGPPTAEELEQLRVLLGAEEPPPPPPAPAFSLGPLSNESCRGQGCALVFLSRPLTLKEIPGLEGGKPRDDSAAWGDADARLVGMLADQPLTEGKARGLFVGALTDVPLAAGWSLLDDPAARQAFGLAANETAVVVVDRQGRLALRETGVIPFWKLAPLDELLSLPPRAEKK